MQLNTRKVEAAVVLALLFIFTFYPMLNSGYSTNDDIRTQLRAQSLLMGGNYFALASEEAKHQGRFSYFLLMIVPLVPYLISKAWFFQLISKGSIIVSLLLFYYVVKRFSSSRRLGLLSLAIFLIAVQENWDHNLLTSYPFGFSLGIIIFLAVLLLVDSYCKTKRWPYLLLSLALTFLSFAFYEFFLLYSLLILLVIYWNQDRESGRIARLKRSILAFLPFLATGCVYVAVYVGFRMRFPPDYEGSQLAFSLAPALRVIWQYSISSFPLYYYSHYGFFYNAHSAMASVNPNSILNLLGAMRVEWLAKAIIAAAFLACVMGIEDKKLGKRSIAALIGISLFLIVAPTLLVALTPKYQLWVRSGSLGYTINYFSFFGVVLLIGSLAIWCHDAVTRIGVKRAIGLAGIVLVAYTSLATDYGNSIVEMDKSLSMDKWRMIDYFATSEEFKGIPEGSVIYAPSLWAYRGNVGIDPSYWSEYISKAGRKRIAVREKLEEFEKDIAAKDYKALYYLKYSEEPKEHDQFLLLSRLEPKDEFLLNNRLYSKEFSIIVNSKNKAGFVFGQTGAGGPGANKVYLDKFAALSTESPFFSLRLDNSRSFQKAYVSNEVSSEAPIDLASVSLTFFMDHDRYNEYGIEWGRGFYDLEGNPENNWRWCGPDGEISVINNTKEAKRFSLNMTAYTTFAEKSRLTVESDFFSKEYAVSSKGAEIAIDAMVKPGIHSMRISCDSERVAAPSDPRVLVFRILNFRQSVGSGAQAGAGTVAAELMDAKVTWAKGFYDYEGTGESNWRWCAASGGIVVDNPNGRDMDVEISMSLMTQYPERTRLSITGDLMQGEYQINNSPKEIVVGLRLRPGSHTISFSSSAKRVDAPSDPRELYFRVFNFSVRKK
jgi:hypothetical protein